MKKTVLMFILLMFVPFLISSKSLEQQWLDYANKCYQNQNYDKAASAYDAVLKINPNNIQALTYGGYAYMSLNNAPKALKYLQKAYSLTGDDSLKAQIDSIKATTGAQAETAEIVLPTDTGAALVGQGIAPASAQKDSPYKWFLIGADVIFAGASLITYLDYNNTVNNYNSTYSQIDNTTVDNYNTLLSMRNSALGKQTTFQIFTALACACVADTMADMFFIHAAFPVSAEYVPVEKSVELSYRMEF